MEFSFVFYLPIGILVAAVLAWIVTVVEKVVKRKNYNNSSCNLNNYEYK